MRAWGGTGAGAAGAVAQRRRRHASRRSESPPPPRPSLPVSHTLPAPTAALPRASKSPLTVPVELGVRHARTSSPPRAAAAGSTRRRVHRRSDGENFPGERDLNLEDNRSQKQIDLFFSIRHATVAAGRGRCQSNARLRARRRWKSGPCSGAISQPALHAALPFVGVPASAIGKRGTDGSVWTWGAVPRSSMGRQAPGRPPSGPLPGRFADKNGPRKGRPKRPNSTCALSAMQCRNGIASDIARALELVSGALWRLEGLQAASGWLG